MLARTHILAGLFLALIFLDYSAEPFLFVFVVLVSSILPDIDTKNSKLGKSKILRPMQFFVRHRGIFHSFTFLMLLTIFFFIFIEEIAFPFFLGYGSHLLLDGMTVHGIRPFYPFKKIWKGRIRTGGRLEILFFVFLLVGVLFLILARLLDIFGL